ncbi:hypothetical protein M9H77_08283 [Catharanthus roseus]|uniref:Uncharacterized protein n=1 Tax=Catharanthus roseus TaxID=4058 RepID=A0ACC0BXC1_CATRO|nr:hypothetical protein M9H77_08283 [Catharanthus roseus]
MALLCSFAWNFLSQNSTLSPWKQVLMTIYMKNQPPMISNIPEPAAGIQWNIGDGYKHTLSKNRWCIDSLSFNLPDHIKQYINSYILPITSPASDQYFWVQSPDGAFRSKSAYHVIFNKERLAHMIRRLWMQYSEIGMVKWFVGRSGKDQVIVGKDSGLDLKACIRETNWMADKLAKQAKFMNEERRLLTEPPDSFLKLLHANMPIWQNYQSPEGFE